MTPNWYNCPNRYARQLAQYWSQVMPETFTPWDAANHLHTRDDARLYLEACAAEDPGDGSLISAAVADIARSGIANLLAQEIGMSRESLYKDLLAKDNPSFATVLRIARALGLQVRITA